MSNVPYRPVVTDGAPDSFNPKCNQSTSAGVTSNGTPSAAEVAAKAQAKYAEQQAQQEAWRKATERRQSGAPKGRMLRPDEIE